MTTILRSLGRSATTAGLFGRRCRLLSEAASDHQIAKNSGRMNKGSASAMMQQERDAAGSGVQSIWEDDPVPSPRLLFWSRIVRVSIITYVSFRLGEISANNAHEKAKAEAELPGLEAVDSTTA